MERFFRVPNSVFNLELSSSEILVLIYLYRCQNNSIAFPSYATIARNCHLKRLTCIRVVKMLEEMSIIQIVRQTGRVNHYLVSI